MAVSVVTSSVSDLQVTTSNAVYAYSSANINGGLVSGTDAFLTIADGASLASNVSVLSGGQLVANTASGQYAYNVSNVTVGNGGSLVLRFLGQTFTLNGSDYKPSVGGWGGSVKTVDIQSGGVVNQYTVTYLDDVTVESAGKLVLDLGRTEDFRVSSGGTIVISRGDIARGVVSGGIIYAGQLDSSAQYKATTSSVTLSAGGQLIASGNGRTSNTLLYGSGTAEILSAGAIATGTQVTSGTVQTVYAGGIASASVVSSAGVLNVSGGTTVSATVSANGTLNLYSGGADSGTIVKGAGATVALYSATSAVNTIVASGANQIVYTSAVASGSIVSNGGHIQVSGGKTVGSILKDGQGAETVYAGGVASNTSASGGAWLSISAQGSAVGTVLKDAGTAEVLYSGATATGTLVTSNAGQTVHVGGVASGTLASAGGHIFLDSGKTVNATVTGAGSYEHIYNGGIASNTTVVSQGEMTVQGKGSVVGGSIGAQGNLYVQDGTASGVLISGSGASATTQSSTSLISGATVVSGGALSVSAGIASATTLSNGGTETVFNAGSAVDTTLYSGAVLNLSSGSVVSGVIVPQGVAFSGGGTVNLYSGVINSLSVSNGGIINISSGAVGSSNIVASGGKINVYASGLATGVTVQSNGSVSATGGSLTNLLINSGGTVSAASGVLLSGTTTDRGVLSGGTVTSSAFVNVVSSGSAVGVTIANSGTLTVTQASVQNTIVQSGGLLSGGESGAYNGTTTILSGGHVRAGEVHGTLTVSSGGDATGVWVMSGATFQASAGSILSGSTTLSAGGTVSMASGAKMDSNASIWIRDGGNATIWGNTGGSVNLNGSTNTGLSISGLASGGTASTKINVTTEIDGFDGATAGNSDGIKIAGVKQSDIKAVAYADTNGVPSGDYVTLTLQNGATITLHIPDAQDKGYSLSQQADDGSVLFEVCFLAGSMIRTGSGDVAVETLRIGDTVVTWNWKTQVAVERKVVWTGRRAMTVKAERADDEAGYPVRILKNAIAENVPSQDLLVTPEHCLFFDNRFVPVRMLVNGRSIFYDRSITAYDYFHIETEEHAVIWANDTLTESYLDTGNRSTFAQDGSVVRLVPRASEKTWDADGAAKLSVERGFVEPLFNALSQRAEAKGFASQCDAVDMTQYSDIHLVTERGRIIQPARQVKDTVVFMIPADVATVRIATRTSRPSDTIGPFVDDRRHLGVLVGQITLFDGTDDYAVTAHLDQVDLAGWYVQEAVPCRWTNGDAMLPLPSGVEKGLRMLTLQVIAAGPYVVKKTYKQARALKV